jgi:hypothetical protein
MKRNILIRLSVVIGILALACNASGADLMGEQVKELAQRYAQVEAQLSRSVRYMKKEDSDGGTTIEQAWLDGAGFKTPVRLSSVLSLTSKATLRNSASFIARFRRMAATPSRWDSRAK